jgi:membrane-associated phospholipid phosphatase
MKGRTLARYLILVNTVFAAAGAPLALPQQEPTVSPAQETSTTIEAPRSTPTVNTNNSTQTSPWLANTLDNTTTAATRIFDDQKHIWLSPLNLRLSDAEWLMPFTGLTSAMILTDSSFSKALPNSPHRLDAFNHLRTGSVGALGAASGGLYLWSLHTHDQHQRETGLLAAEAVIDSLIVTEGLKLAAGRQRPLEANGQGRFFDAGNSFPSNHSAAAWAAAGVLVHEYPGPMTKLLAYGLASAVSITSVSSKQHFPSDAFIGSALGWAVSEYVYRAHHNAELGGSSWNPVRDLFKSSESGPAKYPGSTYVPLDSWVYLAFDRLSALGYLSAGNEDARPWSREKCARLLLDVDQALANSASANLPENSDTLALVQALHHEFAREEATFTGPNTSAAIESVYARVLSASGTVLNDGYHFGQTIAYDDGRPFREGTNLVDGASASATYGNLFFYVNGEYQHSPSAPPLSLPVREFFADRDKIAVPPAMSFSTINRFELLNAYAGFNFYGWQVSFGNQSLSWGPGIGGSLLLSNNASPFPTLRISPEHPIRIPGLSKLFGPVNVEQFYGRLRGHTGPNQPWIYGQKLSFKPVRSFEFAYSRVTMIGGNDYPLTSKQFFLSLVGQVDPAEDSVPGDTSSDLTWTWRVPGLRDRVTFYGELEDEDDFIPVQNPGKNVVRPGLYFPRLPFLPKWDLHFEYTSSTCPGRASFQNHGDFNYWNFEYPDGYTNYGDLMANTVGREGVSLQAWVRYWASPRRTLDFSWKQNIVLNDYVPGGGKWQDYQASYSVTRRSGLYFKGLIQFEHIFAYPLLFAGSRNNLVASVELGFLPPWGRQSALSTTADNTQTGRPLP